MEASKLDSQRDGKISSGLIQRPKFLICDQLIYWYAPHRLKVINSGASAILCKHSEKRQ